MTYLKQMGACPNFIDMITTLFDNASTRVSVNGIPIEPFKLKRSTTQGCPLAPLLYAIASDGLNWLLYDRMEKNLLEGVHPSKNTQVYFEMFADDTML